jgi:hypothetical protein
VLISFPTLLSAIKGDKAPVVASEKQHRPQLQAFEKIPFGCDSAFSPIASAGRIKVLRRCVVWNKFSEWDSGAKIHCPLCTISLCGFETFSPNPLRTTQKVEPIAPTEMRLPI